jgi:hypothetical protein
MKNSKLLKKFNLNESIAGGHLRVTLNNFLELDNITLMDNKGDYLIHIEYYSKENKYIFSAYREKK